MQYTGCRPTTPEEFDALIGALNGQFRTRNAALFTLARYTGYRISELLSIKVGQVWDGQSMRASVTVSREKMKGKRFSRTLPLHRIAAQSIYFWIKEAGKTGPEWQEFPLFSSRKGTRAMTPITAWRILQDAASRALISTERLGMHSFRKQFAMTMWESEYVQKDMAKMSRLLGHAHFSSTIRYLEFGNGILESAVLAA
jgi:site-specific recombinase XerD